MVEQFAAMPSGLLALLSFDAISRRSTKDSRKSSQSICGRLPPRRNARLRLSLRSESRMSATASSTGQEHSSEASSGPSRLARCLFTPIWITHPRTNGERPLRAILASSRRASPSRSAVARCSARRSSDADPKWRRSCWKWSTTSPGSTASTTKSS